MVIDLDSDSFNKIIRTEDRPVLIQVWAEWCAPCAVFKPIINEIAAENAEKLLVARLNIDSEPKLAQQLNIMDIPTVLVFSNGRQQKLIVGAHSKEKMMSYLETYLR